ncbi:MAG: ribbon-helix-helix domain-containing protein [Alphaproteobacteria bacterium]|nr:ribbon-helix-helix domain-containing protein [Alphaproteobacteria bacterium]
MSKPGAKSAGRSKNVAGRPAGDATTLVNRNVTIEGRRTSLRLEPTMWDAFDEICHRETITRNQLCETIYQFKHASTLTAGVRAFVVNYYRAAATEDGHASMGHGALYRARGNQRRGFP